MGKIKIIHLVNEKYLSISLRKSYMGKIFSKTMEE